MAVPNRSLGGDHRVQAPTAALLLAADDMYALRCTGPGHSRYRGGDETHRAAVTQMGNAIDNCDNMIQLNCD